MNKCGNSIVDDHNDLLGVWFLNGIGIWEVGEGVEGGGCVREPSRKHGFVQCRPLEQFSQRVGRRWRVE